MLPPLVERPWCRPRTPRCISLLKGRPRWSSSIPEFPLNLRCHLIVFSTSTPRIPHPYVHCSSAACSRLHHCLPQCSRLEWWVVATMDGGRDIMVATWGGRIVIREREDEEGDKGGARGCGQPGESVFSMCLVSRTCVCSRGMSVHPFFTKILG
jgi:hypothetical protein